MLVSIIIATYNSGKTISATLQSIKNQTYPKYEIIVIDNCSSDNTLDQISKEKFSKIKIYSEPDKGIYDAWNKGIKYSSGDSIFFLNSDDTFFNPNSLKSLVENLKDNFAAYGNVIYDIDDKLYRNGGSARKLSLAFGMKKFQTPACLFRKEVFNNLGGYNLNYKISADYEFAIKLFNEYSFKSLKYVNTDIVKFSLDGVSNTQEKIAYKEVKQIIRSTDDLPLQVLFTIWNAIRRLKKFILHYIKGTKLLLIYRSSKEIR